MNNMDFRPLFLLRNINLLVKNNVMNLVIQSSKYIYIYNNLYISMYVISHIQY